MPMSVSVYTRHTLQCTLCIHWSRASVSTRGQCAISVPQHTLAVYVQCTLTTPSLGLGQSVIFRHTGEVIVNMRKSKSSESVAIQLLFMNAPPPHIFIFNLQSKPPMSISNGITLNFLIALCDIYLFLCNLLKGIWSTSLLFCMMLIRDLKKLKNGQLSLLMPQYSLYQTHPTVSC